jgi:hypothetical protein
MVKKEKRQPGCRKLSTNLFIVKARELGVDESERGQEKAFCQSGHVSPAEKVKTPRPSD